MVHFGEDMILYIYAFHFADNVLYQSRIISCMTLSYKKNMFFLLGFRNDCIADPKTLILSLTVLLSKVLVCVDNM